MTAQRWRTLPCGNDPEHLLGLAADHARIPPDSHEATCPYCRAALAELGELWRPVRDWARRDVVVPRSFLATVVDRVRRIAQSPHHVAATTARGATTVTSWVLGLIASTATQDTPGVAAVTGSRPASRRSGDRRGTVRYGADGVDITEVDAAAVAVTLGIRTGPVPDLVDVADDVRRRVIAAIAAGTGIEVTAVDVSIDDVDPPLA